MYDMYHLERDEGERRKRCALVLRKTRRLVIYLPDLKPHCFVV